MHCSWGIIFRCHHPFSLMMSSFKLILPVMLAILSISKASDESNRAVPATTIYVDQSGSGNYTSVQAAINSVPDNNNQWIRIVIKKGTYDEKVKIPFAKQFIFLQGESLVTTIIEQGDSGNAVQSATFSVFADNFVASDITFKNTHGLLTDTNTTRITWTPAAVVVADKVSFHRCAFYGIQDTIGDLRGRHYFENCVISGAVDFIWGGGQSVYKGCLVQTIASKIGLVGFITAQGRNGAGDLSGFVFIHGRVTGEGQTYLGRAWQQYARVIFYETYMSNVVAPEGWNSWNGKGHETDITFAEVGCFGDGANKSGRVNWLKNLSPQEVEFFTSKSFNNQDGWLKKQP